MRRAAGEQAAPPAVDLPLPVEDSTDDLPNEVVTPALESAPAFDATTDGPTHFPNELAVVTSSAPAEVTPPVADATATEMALRSQINATLATKTVIDNSMMPASREQYRRLAAALHQAQRTSGFKVVMVASAVAGEGKTLTASNLAMTLSESYRRDVLLIDADLRRPSLHLVFQVPGAPGLSDGLITADDPKLPLHRVSERLAILPAGRPTSDPIGALTSERMRRLIDEAREVFDWVVIDTPPVGLLTDASLLSSMADGVVLVVKAESTPLDMVVRAVHAIGRERVIGTVLNRASEQPNRTSYDYYKYYSQAEPGDLTAKR
jgi:capsular exopolysaccharide synthesis family protein